MLVNPNLPRLGCAPTCENLTSPRGGIRWTWRSMPGVRDREAQYVGASWTEFERPVSPKRCWLSWIRARPRLPKPRDGARQLPLKRQSQRVGCG